MQQSANNEKNTQKNPQLQNQRLENRHPRNLLQREGLLLSRDHLGHAFLLSCLDGTYRSEVANALAAHLLGLHLEDTALTQDDVSDWLENHPDFIAVTEEKIPIDLIRGLTQELYKKPLEGARKVIWIANAQGMQAVAQNALLKSLEEPPAWIVWLLCVDNPSKLLPTILSRAQLHQVGQGEARSAGEPIEGLLPAIEQALKGEIIGTFTNRALYDDNKDRKRDLLGQMTEYMAQVLKYCVLQESAKKPETTLELSAWQFRELPIERVEHIVVSIETSRQLLDVNTNFPLSMEHLFLEMARS